MPNNTSLPLFETRDITGRCTAAVTGKRFVVVSATMSSGPGLSATSEGGNISIAPCGAGAKAFGVAAYDAAINTRVPVHGNRKIVPVTAGATVTAGQEVESDATGRAITLASGKSNGLAITSATVGNDVFVAIH